jgi:hypothetical protein
VEIVRDALHSLNLGKSVAEFDDALEKYFVETNAFRELVQNRCDVIAGDKGTGKTAIYRILQKKYRSIPELEKIEVIPAFNPSGSPIFQQLTTRDVLPEPEYNHLWKAYLVLLLGNWLLNVYEGEFTPAMSNLDKVLRGLELRTEVDAPRSAFARALGKIGALFNWRSVEMECTVSESGIPIITPKLELADSGESRVASPSIPADAILRLLDVCLKEADITAWVALDRLDEAFSGHPGMEVPALRALLRTYLDLTEFEHIRLKLFVRRDLFSRVTSGGFVNLTHINARKLDIVWREADLLNLLCRRIRENSSFCSALSIVGAGDKDIFDVLFPRQVDSGKRKPATWTWMMRRIRDGNDVKPPRNLIDLVQLSQDAQLKREDIQGRPLSARPLLEPDALRDGLSQLSVRRVDDTIFAEAGSTVQLIEKFRGGKAEHNIESIASLFGVSTEQAKVDLKPLVAIGFLEVIKGSFKVPSLFREGMKITQGKAFDDTASSSAEDEDEDE